MTARLAFRRLKSVQLATISVHFCGCDFIYVYMHITSTDVKPPAVSRPSAWQRWGMSCICMWMVRFEEASERISDDCSCNRARQAARSLTKLYDDALRPSGLLLSQATLLVAIARFGEQGANMARLADVLVMDRTTLTRNLRPLETAGLLRVARAPGDDRLRVLFLTRAGERKIEAAFPLWERAQHMVRKRFGERRADTLRDELAELVHDLQGLDSSDKSAPAQRPRRSKR